MQVFSKNAYRFTKPGQSILSAPAEKVGDQTQTVTGQPSFESAFFELKSGEFQEAPEWIQEDQMFKWALADGDIKLVSQGSSTSEEPKSASEEQGNESTSESEQGDEPSISRHPIHKHRR